MKCVVCGGTSRSDVVDFHGTDGPMHQDCYAQLPLNEFEEELVKQIDSKLPDAYLIIVRGR